VPARSRPTLIEGGNQASEYELAVGAFKGREGGTSVLTDGVKGTSWGCMIHNIDESVRAHWRQIWTYFQFVVIKRNSLAP
jgi:hypothetical protein